MSLTFPVKCCIESVTRVWSVAFWAREYLALFWREAQQAGAADQLTQLDSS